MTDDQTSTVAAALLTGPSGPSIYIVGGSGLGATTASNRVQVFDPVADTMSELFTDPWPASPTGQVIPGGRAVFNNKLYILGGFNIGVSMTDQIWEFDPMRPAGSRWVLTSAHLPTPLGYVPADAIGSYIYIAGGSEYSGVTLVHSQHTYRYDPV